MAYMVTLRTEGPATSASSQTATTASFTPAANSKLYVYCYCRNNGNSTLQNESVSGGSLTWTRVAKSTQRDFGGFAASESWLYVADVGGSPSSMTITLDGNTGTTDTFFYTWIVFDVTASAGEVLGILQSVANSELESEGASETITGTLPAAAANGNLVVACFGADGSDGEAIATPTGFTSLAAQTTHIHAAVFYRTNFTGTAITTADLGNAPATSAVIAFESGPELHSTTGTIALTTASTGSVTKTAGATGAVSLGLTVGDDAAKVGAAGGAMTVVLAADGDATKAGDTTGAMGLATIVGGSTVKAGDADGTLALVLTSLGDVDKAADAVGTIDLAIDATGTVEAIEGGQTIGQIALALAASGTAAKTADTIGSADIALDLAGTTTSERTTTGTIGVALGTNGIATKTAATVGALNLVMTIAGLASLPPTGTPSISRTWRVRADDRVLAPIHDRIIRVPANTGRTIGASP